MRRGQATVDAVGGTVDGKVSTRSVSFFVDSNAFSSDSCKNAMDKGSAANHDQLVLPVVMITPVQRFENNGAVTVSVLDFEVVAVNL